MEIKWNFKIKLKEDSLEKAEKSLGAEFPKDLREFIEKNNAASPDKSIIMLNGCERVLDAVLSFNDEETEATTFKSVFRAIGNKQLIPFAGDPFGNYFCYSLRNGKIAYYHHEEQCVDETDYTLETFIDNLH